MSTSPVGRPVRRWWRAFAHSPYYPAAVLSLIVAASAALFAGSYTYAIADPTPHRLPIAMVAGAETPQTRSFLASLERHLDTSLDPRTYPSYPQAVDGIESQHVFAIIRARNHRVELDIASAAGATVAELLTQRAPRAAEAAGAPLGVRDLKPLSPRDPRGLAIFYISIAAVIVGFLGAVQLSIHARALNPPERIAVTAAYSLLGGLAITAVVGPWWLDALPLPILQSWLTLAVTMFAAGMVFTMFNTLIGRWAILPTWGLMVMIGNPSSGGAVSWPLLPSPFATIGRWLPPGASVNAQHTAIYFRDAQHLQPYLVLTGWAVAACAVFWIWRHRHPGGRD
ncbi:ABC transporter permease [Streptomyces sp. 6N223]|uniref:ABC transporter permease n=1 Tax=Streptomyces sp. 6N223 TaxID=3457412 RepID=UPI003FD41C76